jgi:hypothetical protein
MIGDARGGHSPRAGDPPDFAGEAFGIDRLDRVEDGPIMNGPSVDHGSGIGAVVETLYDRQ